MTIEAKLTALGLALPDVPKPVANYRPTKRVGALVFTSGQTARINGVRRFVGKVGAEVTDEDAYLSARDVALNCLACAAWAAGGIDQVKGVVKVTGFVNCIDGYEKQPSVINGASGSDQSAFRRLRRTRAVSNRRQCASVQRFGRVRGSFEVECDASPEGPSPLSA